MTYDSQRHHRRSIRLPGFDYAQPGAYVVTICAAARACVFGDVVDGERVVNRVGWIVEDAWSGLPGRFRGIAVDAFVVMPNHVHGIVLLGAVPDVAAESEAPSWGKGAMNRAPTIQPRGQSGWSQDDEHPDRVRP